MMFRSEEGGDSPRGVAQHVSAIDTWLREKAERNVTCTWGPPRCVPWVAIRCSGMLWRR